MEPCSSCVDVCPPGCLSVYPSGLRRGSGRGVGVRLSLYVFRFWSTARLTPSGTLRPRLLGLLESTCPWILAACWAAPLYPVRGPLAARKRTPPAPNHEEAELSRERPPPTHSLHSTVGAKPPGCEKPLWVPEPLCGVTVCTRLGLSTPPHTGILCPSWNHGPWHLWAEPAKEEPQADSPAALHSLQRGLHLRGLTPTPPGLPVE